MIGLDIKTAMETINQRDAAGCAGPRVVTLNRGTFDGMAGLIVVNWTK